MSTMVYQVEHACSEILARVEESLLSIRAIIETVKPNIPRGLLNALCLGVLRNYIFLGEALRYCGYKGSLRGTRRGWLVLVVAYEAVFRRGKVSKERLTRIVPRLSHEILSCLYSVEPREIIGRYSGLRRLSIAYSIPLWVVSKLAETNPPGGIEELLKGFQEPTPMWIRFNKSLITIEEAMHELKNHGVETIPDKILDDLLEVVNVKPGAIDRLDKKKYYVHDRSAALVAHILRGIDGYGGDFFSAPGNKIAHIAWRKKVLGVALELSQRRLSDERFLLNQQGVWVYDVIGADARKPPIRDSTLNWAIVDPDCSSMGRLGHSPETRLFLEKVGPLIIHRFSRLQYRGLREALLKTKRNGVVVYTTCTLTLEENEGVVKKVIDEGLAELEEASPLIGYWSIHMPRTQRIVPHISRCTGGFVAKLRRV